MQSINVDNDLSSNEEENNYEIQNEKASLKQNKIKSGNYPYRKKKKINNKNNCIKRASFIIIFLVLSFLFTIIFIQLSLNYKKDGINLKKVNNNNSSIKEDIKVPKNEEIQKIKGKEIETEKNINIIEDIKNVDIKPLGDAIKSMSDEILEQNSTKKKIGIAFIYSTLSANGIGRFITVTAKYLQRTGKYNIYFITGKPYNREFSYSPEIKRFIAYNNYTLMRNISKYEKIDVVVLQNVLAPSVVKFHRNLGQKVICMFHGCFFSAMYGNHVTSYKNWDQFDYCDSFVFIASDDYYFYKRLGFKNEIFMPNLYTYDPYEIKSSNLTTHNIIILGRLNDFIKGVKYAIRAMKIIVKEVPDAKLYLVSSDSRVQHLKNLTRDLDLSKNIVFKGGTFNLTEIFYNCSVHMYTSLSEAFPMALIEGKAHGMPVVGFDVPYSNPYQQGFIGVELFDVEGLARETIKLLKDYDYRKRKGEEAKKSLDVFKIDDVVNLWGRLCDSLLSSDREDYRKLQDEIEKKYWDDANARKHFETHFNILLKHDYNLTCHSLDNFTDINYLKTISKCNSSNINMNYITGTNYYGK